MKIGTDTVWLRSHSFQADSTSLSAGSLPFWNQTEKIYPSHGET